MAPKIRKNWRRCPTCDQRLDGLDGMTVLYGASIMLIAVLSLVQMATTDPTAVAFVVAFPLLVALLHSYGILGSGKEVDDGDGQ